MFINLTPHPINIHNADGDLVTTVAPSGTVARVSQSDTVVDTVDGVDILAVTYGDLDGLPDPVDGTMYIVSGMVRAATDRADVLSPGPLIRNDAGQPIGCRGLVRN